MKVMFEEWVKVWNESVRLLKELNTVDYWNRRAWDYNDYQVNSEFDTGRRIKDIFKREGILYNLKCVMDIGAGPGSITIPFAKSVDRVVAIEPSEEMRKYLLLNAANRNLNNIEVIPDKWEDVDVKALENSFDLVLCVHAIWHFPSLTEQITRMNTVSRGYCCIADSIKGKNNYSEMYYALDLPITEEIDYTVCVYNTLYGMGIKANVKVIDTVMKRSVESAINMWELLVEKYRKLTDWDKKLIRDHVLANSVDGMYERWSKMAVIWWEV